MMKVGDVTYAIEGRRFVGFLADGSNGSRVPGVLVAHEGGDMTDHPKERARMLAELGLVAFAMDTFAMDPFGERPQTMEQAKAKYGVREWCLTSN